MADFTQQQQQYIAHAYSAPLNGNMMYGNVMDPSIACRPSMYHQQQQFNFQFASGHIQPQHHQQARRLQLLQQQQAMYQQQLMEYQQRQQQFEHQQQQHQLGSPGKRFQTKAEKRAEHNAIERARRENLNTKFQQLAHSLPNLQNDRRPSKGTIIERTLDYVKQTVQKEERLIREIRRLREENEELMQQLYSTGERTDQDSLKSCPSLVMTQEGASSVGGDLDSNSLLGSSWEVMFQNSSQAAPVPGSSSTSPVGFDSDDDNSSTNADDLDLNNAAAISTAASFANMPTEFIGKLTSTPSNTEFKVQSQQK